MKTPAHSGSRAPQDGVSAAEEIASGVHLAELTDKQAAFASQIADSSISDGFPTASAWHTAHALRFSADWQGKNADPQRATEVRLLWTPAFLFLQFRARYLSLTVFPGAASNGRRDQLWDRDVVEVFLQPNPSEARRYNEFEVSPNGFWIDLAIAPGEKHDLRSGLRRRAAIDEPSKTWTAELAIPMRSLVERVEPLMQWRVNFFRVEGTSEPRFYSAWRPTNTPQPNFHVPEAFGQLIFAPPVTGGA
jgi:alpha-galactosidase